MQQQPGPTFEKAARKQKEKEKNVYIDYIYI
jgi:hypothetical protein